MNHVWLVEVLGGDNKWHVLYESFPHITRKAAEDNKKTLELVYTKHVKFRINKYVSVK